MASQRCPPGIICLDNMIGLILCGILVFLSMGFLFLIFQLKRPGLPVSSIHNKLLRKFKRHNKSSVIHQDDSDIDIEINNNFPVIDHHHPLPPGPPFQPQISPLFISQQFDNIYTRAPQPLRSWLNPPEFPPRGGIASIPINIPTQGLPEQFGTIGVVEVEGDVWPLYGRRTGRASDRWNYYTRNNTQNPVPLPLKYQKRDCMDDVGCQELLSGEHVNVDVLGKDAKVTIYRTDGPKYFPGLF